jgi:hypothetical protein
MASKYIRGARYVVRRLPFYLLALKALWLVLAALGVYVSDYWFISELQGHSVALCLLLAYYAYVNRSCLYIWVCIFSLFGLNVLNMLYFFFSFPYLNYYAGTITVAGLLFTLIDVSNRHRRRRSAN